jgi:hypothetical protein
MAKSDVRDALPRHCCQALAEETVDKKGVYLCGLSGGGVADTFPLCRKAGGRS